MRGWPGGEEWITTQTLLARKQFLARVFRGEQAPMMRPMAMAARVRYRPEDEAALEAVRARVLAPEYELK